MALLPGRLPTQVNTSHRVEVRGVTSHGSEASCLASQVQSDSPMFFCRAQLPGFRLAPLSEGRIESDGTLACSYHGWRFNASGACTKIPQVSCQQNCLPASHRKTCVPWLNSPLSGATGLLFFLPLSPLPLLLHLAASLELQAENPAAAVAACSNKRSCAVAYPTRVASGLLWVWPDASPSSQLESAASEPFQHPAAQEFLKQGTWGSGQLEAGRWRQMCLSRAAPCN